jgi:hypothetical protein
VPPVPAVVDLMVLSVALARLSRLRQPDREFAALPEPRTRRGHTTAMQFREHTHPCQTDAQTGSGARSGLIRLYEEIKYVRQTSVARELDDRCLELDSARQSLACLESKTDRPQRRGGHLDKARVTSICWP